MVFAAKERTSVLSCVKLSKFMKILEIVFCVIITCKNVLVSIQYHLHTNLASYLPIFAVALPYTLVFTYPKLFTFFLVLCGKCTLHFFRLNK